MYTNRGFMQREYSNPYKYPSPSNSTSLSPKPKRRWLEEPKIQISSPYPSSYSPVSHKKIQRNSSNSTITPVNFFSSLEGKKEFLKETREDKYNNSAYTSSTELHLAKSMPQLPELSPPQDTTRNYSRTINSKIYDDISIRKPVYAIDAVFEIYGVGYAYATKTGYGHPLGMGFLITKTLAMTAHSVIPDEEVATRCFARFTDNLYEAHHFDAGRFFYTNRGLNFTIVGFMLSEESIKPRLPLEIREGFQLKDGDGIAYLNSGTVPRIVTHIDNDVFSYTAGNYISPGMPIFTTDWRIQGIHHTCTNSYRFNQGTRIDAVIRTLVNIKEIATHPELDLLLSDYAKAFGEGWDSTKATFGDSRYMYWIEWYNRNIYRYDIPLERWTCIKISNLEEFLRNESSSWNFNWGCRLVYVPDGSFYILGGVGHELSSTKADVFYFASETRELSRRASMLERREGPAVLYRQNYLYVMGGKYSYNTCEKYSITDDSWTHFSPMIHGRFEPVASLLQGEEHMYVIGGYPQELVGRSIERYIFREDRWEALQILLPVPCLHSGIYQVNYQKIALLGGRFSRSVFIFDVTETQLGNTISQAQDEMFRIYEIESFPDQLETVYPLVYYKEDNKVYFIKSVQGESPMVLFYPYRSFMRGPAQNPIEYRRTVKLPPINTNSYITFKRK